MCTALLRACLSWQRGVGFLRRLRQASRSLGVSQLSGKKVNYRDTYAVLHFIFAEVVEMRSPMAQLLQIFRDALGQENVAGIAAIHYSLRHVDPLAGYVHVPTHVNDPADRPAMNAHPQLQTRVLL